MGQVQTNFAQNRLKKRPLARRHHSLPSRYFTSQTYGNPVWIFENPPFPGSPSKKKLGSLAFLSNDVGFLTAGQPFASRNHCPRASHHVSRLALRAEMARKQEAPHQNSISWCEQTKGFGCLTNVLMVPSNKNQAKYVHSESALKSNCCRSDLSQPEVEFLAPKDKTKKPKTRFRALWLGHCVEVRSNRPCA